MQLRNCSKKEKTSCSLQSSELKSIHCQLRNRKEIKMVWYGYKTRTALIKKLKVRQNSTKSQNLSHSFLQYWELNSLHTFNINQEVFLNLCRGVPAMPPCWWFSVGDPPGNLLSVHLGTELQPRTSQHKEAEVQIMHCLPC